MQIKGSNLGFYNNALKVLRQYYQRCILSPTCNIIEVLNMIIIS